jgi:hypothetical protein
MRRGPGWLTSRKLGKARPQDQDFWLLPVDESVALECLGPQGGRAQFREDIPAARRLERGGLFPFTLDQYLKLLDWTGQQVRADKAGAIPDDVAPILERLGVSGEGWCELTENFGDWYRYAAGVADN